MPYTCGKSVVYRFGERGSGLAPKGPIQDFYKLRDSCVSKGILFEDPNFLPEYSSIFFSRTQSRPLRWRRPTEIVKNPRLFVDGASRFDIVQGELGNCWLLAAMANLTLHKCLFVQVVPEDQSFVNKYAGIFHFRFWQYGRWIDVVIDDRLPTLHGKLLFLRSSEQNEFWSPLLEKAYAKLHGSYEALKEGTTAEAMEDFTGGITEMFDLTHELPYLNIIMVKASERKSLMACSIEPDPNVVEAQTPDGLVKGHAYSITMVKYIPTPTQGRSGKILLIRIRNPWGNKIEWNGPWSDKSPEWRLIPEHEKQTIGLVFEDDGEFWMSFKDFKDKFSRLEICSLNPKPLEEEMFTSDKKRWEMNMFEGEWVRGVTAGGCRNYLDTFWHNPQYRITLKEIDEDDDEEKCTVVVALMQKNRRSLKMMGAEVLSIGFVLYLLDNPETLPKPLGLEFFRTHRSYARSPSFFNLREVSSRFKFPPGVYCIVPSTFEPNEEGEFVLRVFSEHRNDLEENDEKLGLREIDYRVSEVPPEPEEQEEKFKAKEFFHKIAGEDMEINWMGLKEILDSSMRKETKKEGFSKEICRSMVAMKDVDKSGMLGYEEFKVLWKEIHDWTAVFKLYDKEGTGSLNSFELRQALNSAGYTLNSHILNVLGHRYGSKNRMISFEDFMMCAVKLKEMIDIFKERDHDDTQTATFSMDEWIEKSLYS